MSLFRKQFVFPPLFAVAVLALSSCGGGGDGGTAQRASQSPPAIPVPAFSHVVLVVMENQSFESVIGNPAMPFLNRLAEQHGLATNYLSDSKNSLQTHFMLNTGRRVPSDLAQAFTEDNVVRRLLAAGKTWKSYAQGLPNVGYMGDNVGTYIKRHNPFVYFTDVLNDAAQQANVVPFTQFAADLGASSLPNYSWVLPDQEHNTHDCPGGGNRTCTTADKLAVADKWLETEIGPVLESGIFRQSGLLLFVFNAGDETDTRGGGGRVPLLVVSPRAKPGFRSSTALGHASALKVALQALGVNGFPGDSATAPGMGEFFVQQ